MNEINKRIIQVADYYRVDKPADFAKKTGFSHQVASNYLKGTRIPNTEALCIIKQKFDISADWLLTGEGEMLKKEMGKCAVITEIVYKPDPRDAEILASNKDTIEIQKKLISSLEQRIKELESGSFYSKYSGFHTVQSVDTTNPNQTGGKAKRPNK